MRKIVLALLVLLLTVPAMAGIEVVKCAQVSDTNQVTVTYDVNDGNEIRAFGIKIHVDNTASIINLVVNDANYSIFPGSIDINSVSGQVDYAGTPIGPNDSNSFILEMGSLYVGAVNAPPDTQQLCSFYVDGDCNVSIDHDAARGGVVLANTSKSFDGDLIGCQVTLLPDKCFPSCRTAEYAEWVSLGEPNSWCNVRQCYGDTDKVESTFGNPPPPMFPWAKSWVTVEDLQIVVNGYELPYGGNPEVDTWIAADFNRQENTFGNPPPPMFPWAKARVTVEDLQVLVNNYELSVSTDCLDCP